MPRAKSSIISPKEEAVVDTVLRGATLETAVRQNKNLPGPVRRGQVLEALEEAREEIKQASKLTRIDVIAGIIEAIDMARQMAEPATMINGYDKLAKIIGAYEPEVKRLDITINGNATMNNLDRMSTEELLRIAEGTVIYEGEAHEVH